MADVVDQATRSRMMSGIRGKNTRPELTVRKALHARGYRYRLHAKELPGRPDLVLPKHRAVIFIHGCFWHGHECSLFKWPSSRPEFWREKISKNVERDTRSIQTLQESGWRVAVLWECAVRSKGGLVPTVETLASWLESGEARLEIRG